MARKSHTMKRNKARRLRRSFDHRNWTLEQWKLVLWRDESRLTLFRSHGHVWVWQLSTEWLLPECIVPIRQFGADGVMGWGCFSYYSVGPLEVVHGTMNSQAYYTIWVNEMLPTLWRFYARGPCYFQDDSASSMFQRLLCNGMQTIMFTDWTGLHRV